MSLNAGGKCGRSDDVHGFGLMINGTGCRAGAGFIDRHMDFGSAPAAQPTWSGAPVQTEADQQSEELFPLFFTNMCDSPEAWRPVRPVLWCPFCRGALAHRAWSHNSAPSAHSARANLPHRPWTGSFDRLYHYMNLRLDPDTLVTNRTMTRGSF